MSRHPGCWRHKVAGPLQLSPWTKSCTMWLCQVCSTYMACKFWSSIPGTISKRNSALDSSGFPQGRAWILGEGGCQHHNPNPRYWFPCEDQLEIGAYRAQAHDDGAQPGSQCLLGYQATAWLNLNPKTSAHFLHGCVHSTKTYT